MMRLLFFFETMLILVCAWVLLNLAHAFLTMKKGRVEDKFFCLSNWMKKDSV